MKPNFAKGLCPDRAAQGVSPIFRASLVQTSAALRPFRSAFGSLSKGGYTPPLAPCYPRLRQVAFGMYMPRFNAEVQKPEPQRRSSNDPHPHCHPHQRKP